MILININELPNGQCLANLDIIIKTKHHHRTKLGDTSIKYWLTNEIKKWVISELTAFCNQRETAYKYMGVYALHHATALQNIRTIIRVNNATAVGLYNKILLMQETLRNLCPAAGSPQAIWIQTIEEIIQYAYDYIHAKEPAGSAGVSTKGTTTKVSHKIQNT